MKKVLSIMLALLCTVILVSCSSTNDEDPVFQPSETITNVWNTLNGSYKGTFFITSTSDKVWYTETIKFQPYTVPMKITPLITYDRGDIYAYGTAEIEDTRFTSISGTSHCYYVIKDGTEKDILTITFYKYDIETGYITGGEDKRNIRNWNSTQFSMWGYGLTETQNSHIYEK